MGTARIHFVGICTHLQETTTAGLGALHRAVLINASGANVVNTMRIAPHFAKIKITSPNVNTTVPLNGVALTIETAGADSVTYDDSYGKIIPSLRALMDGIETLSDPDPDLVVNGSWPAVAAYFNVRKGTFDACVDVHGAAVVGLTIVTDGDLMLTATPFLNGTAPFESPLNLGATADIVVENNSNEVAGTPLTRDHFLLHYLLARNMPAVPQIPLSINPVRRCENPYSLFNTGCSDSNYP